MNCKNCLNCKHSFWATDAFASDTDAAKVLTCCDEEGYEGKRMEVTEDNLCENFEEKPKSPFERESESNFSFWFPKVENCGFSVPKTVIFKINDICSESEKKELFNAFCMEDYVNDMKTIQKFVDEKMIPVLREQKLTGHLFVKNARFSNKFNAKMSCNIYGVYTLASAIANINNEDMCLDVGGWSEVVVREFIESNSYKTPCIYNGLPLRTEFRVFYDFDTRKVLYTANYWNYDYVAPHLYDATDRIVFEHEKGRIAAEYEECKDELAAEVELKFQKVQGLTGQWSIDFLLERGGLWLIDMAIAQRSAYWDQRPADCYPN